MSSTRYIGVNSGYLGVPNAPVASSMRVRTPLCVRLEQCLGLLDVQPMVRDGHAATVESGVRQTPLRGSPFAAGSHSPHTVTRMRTQPTLLWTV